jgi:valyl-tRNA synthetase
VNKEPNGGGATIAAKAIAAVRPNADGKKAIRFTPEQYEKTFLNWMENIYDWCISRQLWWGHRIPAWHCDPCGKITVARVDPTTCAHCGSGKLTQETDVLDTWFSSGLLPVSVFGWPNFTSTKLGAPGPGSPRTGLRPGGGDPSHLGTGEGGPNRADFDSFYPTSLLVTGFDILFFWVARMIMLGIWFAQEIPEEDGTPRTLARSVPFKEVYIHALVRDANREKMSKTKGNVVDPIEVVKQYGTDAVRFTLASMASPGTDIAFNIARTEGYRAFANKIWNAARFIFQNIDRAAEVGIVVDQTALGSTPRDSADAPLEARWIVAELNVTAERVNQSLENYRFDDAANTIYQFFWANFCDWYLEIVKLRLDFSETCDKARTAAALTTLVTVFESALRLLSPFMPFITEEIWHALYDGNPPARSIASVSYPTQNYWTDLRVLNRMILIQDLIRVVRDERKNRDIPERQPVPMLVITSSNRDFGTNPNDLIYQNADIIQRLARISKITFHERTEVAGQNLNWRSVGFTDIALVHERPIDVPAERDRLTKDIAKYEKGVAAAERQLGNEGFLQKAPPQVVEGLKKQEAETRLLLEKARAALANLPKEPEGSSE